MVKKQNKPPNNRSLATYMKRRGRALFTGREEEIALFFQAIKALKESDDVIEVKRVFNVYGQGGIGKTTILGEFERICEEEKVLCIYIDAKRESGGSILNLVDLLQSIDCIFHKPNCN